MKRTADLVGTWSRTRSRLAVDPVVAITVQAQALFYEHLYTAMQTARRSGVSLPRQPGSVYRWTNGTFGESTTRMGYIQAAMNAPLNAGLARNYVDADAHGRPAVSVENVWNLPYYRNVNRLSDRTVVLSTMVNGVRRWWISKADRGTLRQWTPMVMTDAVMGNFVPLSVRPFRDGYVLHLVNPAISRSRIRR